MSEEKPEEVEPVDEDRAGSDPDVLGEEFSIGWIWEIHEHIITNTRVDDDDDEDDDDVAHLVW